MCHRSGAKVGGNRLKFSKEGERVNAGTLGIPLRPGEPAHMDGHSRVDEFWAAPPVCPAGRQRWTGVELCP